LVFVACLALVLCGIPVVQVSKGSVVYLAYVASLTLAVVAGCWLKCESRRWRWGGRDA
jgi:hypothetical protein